jgi:hypothetical protein
LLKVLHFRHKFTNSFVFERKANMGWGILEDKKTPWPPGTVLLDDVKQLAMIDTTRSKFTQLKKDKHIVLQPQPTDSVNDPLNWPFKRKVAVIFTLIVTGVAVGGMMSMLGTAGRILAERYHIKYPVSTSYHVLLATDSNIMTGTHSKVNSA